jgi:hypothetical protein
VPKPIRGRKVTADEIYIAKSLASIKEWKNDMKGLKFSDKKYKSCRNKIAALESRLKKRAEVKNLKNSLEKSQKMFEKVADIVSTVFEPCSNCSKEMIQAIFEKFQIPSKDQK